MNIKYAILVLCSALFLTACSCSGSYDSFSSEEAVFEEIINTVLKDDPAALKKLFSNSAQRSSPALDSDIKRFIKMFNGEIVTYYRAGGSNTNRKSEHGKISIDIRSSYIVETKSHKYYIAIKYCTKDTFDPNNIGLNCINIITEKDYLSSSVYRGNGHWTPGITFDTRKYENKRQGTVPCPDA